MTLIYEDETRRLRRCFYDVQNEVGLGRQEEAYHQACIIWLRQDGVSFRSKPPHDLMLGDDVAHTLYPDFVIGDAITVELKAVPRKIAQSEFVQLFDYLKCRGDRLGLLVNMGLDRVYIERVVYEARQHVMKEDWQHWSHRIDGRAREVGLEVRTAIDEIFAHHQTGYGEEVTAKLVTCALKRRRLRFVEAPRSKAWFREHLVDESPLDCLVVNQCVVVVWTALFDNNQFNISRGLSFMKSLGISWGIAFNFGREVLEVTGLRVDG